MKSAFSVEGKVALVTGATGLLGVEHCKALLMHGASVIAVDLGESRVNDLCLSLGENAVGMAADVTSEASLKHLRERVVQRFGRLDILVNNAALNDKMEARTLSMEASRFENYPLEVWEQMLRVNVTGTFLCCQVLGSLMVNQRSGSIINIGSTYGLVAPDPSLYQDAEGTVRAYKSPAYPTSKGAVIAFTRFLAAHWGSRGVRVNALCPGGVENGQESYFLANYANRTPLGRMAKPTDYRGAIVFLASDASEYMTGATLVVDGGFTAW